MAKYTVTYKCGHTGTVELFGKESERRRKIAFYEENYICPECYEAEQAAKCAAEEQKYVFPELIGSERQIAWAKTIRLKFVTLRENQAKMNEKRYANTQASQEDIEKHKAMFKAFCDEFFGETSAKVWIDDRRDNDEDEWWFKHEFHEYIRAHRND